MKDMNLYEDINDKEYSKTIEVLLENNNLKKEYLNDYLQIEYQNITNFSTTINKLLEKKYNTNEINYITKKYKRGY